MGWLERISDLVGGHSPPYEKSLVQTLIKDIEWQIKAIEGKRKRLIKEEGKLRKRIDKKDEEKDLSQKLGEYEEENNYLEKHLSILGKKLELAEAERVRIASSAAEVPGISDSASEALENKQDNGSGIKKESG